MIEDIVRRIEQMWQTRPNRAQKATVMDEVEFGLFFLTRYVMDVAVDIYLALRTSLEKHYPDADWSDLPPVLQFASWIAGDRDGVAAFWHIVRFNLFPPRGAVRPAPIPEQAPVK